MTGSPTAAPPVQTRLLLVANLGFANAAAAAAVMGFLQPAFFLGDAGPVLATLAQERVLVLPLGSGAAWGVFLGGLLLLVWNLLWLLRRPVRQAPVLWVTSETPSGPVRIAREALEAGLRQAGEALPEITRLRVQVDTTQQKRVLVTGLFWCAEGQGNLAASQRLRQAMAARCAEMVRPADGARIEFELEFQGFAGKLGKKAGEVPPPEPEGAPFTGPRYPIDDETTGGTA